MLYLTCTTITSIDLAHYGVSRAKDWVSVKCGTSPDRNHVVGLMFSVFLFLHSILPYVYNTCHESSVSHENRSPGRSLG